MNTKQLVKKGGISVILGLAMLVGVIGGNIFKTTTADAQTTTPSAIQNQSASSTKPDGNFDPSKGGHIGANGKKEELLTGDTAEKVKQAALAAVSGGAIERVETDAEGAAYEAHMTKSDGARVTVKLDSSFKVTATEDGFGGHGHK